MHIRNWTNSASYGFLNVDCCYFVHNVPVNGIDFIVLWIWVKTNSSAASIRTIVRATPTLWLVFVILILSCLVVMNANKISIVWSQRDLLNCRKLIFFSQIQLRSWVTSFCWTHYFVLEKLNVRCKNVSSTTFGGGGGIALHQRSMNRYQFSSFYSLGIKGQSIFYTLRIVQERLHIYPTNVSREINNILQQHISDHL